MKIIYTPNQKKKKGGVRSEVKRLMVDPQDVKVI